MPIAWASDERGVQVNVRSASCDLEEGQRKREWKEELNVQDTFEEQEMEADKGKSVDAHENGKKKRRQMVLSARNGGSERGKRGGLTVRKSAWK